LITSEIVDVTESMSQRGMVGDLLIQTTKTFLGKLLSKSIVVHRKETEGEEAPISIVMELDSGPGSGSIKMSEKLLAP
jgi:hypothetical protein